MKFINYLAPILVGSAFIFLYSSCSQPEGFGGNSSIKGVVIERFYDREMQVLQYQEPAIDENVFITFGENQTLGDNTSTSYTGLFQFEYLWPGKYTVYCLTDDTSTQGKTTVIKNIELKNGENFNLDTLYVNTLLDWDQGKATIKGKVRLINYKTSYPEVKDIGPAQDIDVYLVYNNQEGYTERIRTVGDGSYTFSNLLKGSYKVFFYSEDVENGGTANIVKWAKPAGQDSIVITETNQVIELETITIQKK